MLQVKYEKVQLDCSPGSFMHSYQTCCDDDCSPGAVCLEASILLYEGLPETESGFSTQYLQIMRIENKWSRRS